MIDSLDSSVASILGTNFVPTKAQCDDIRADLLPCVPRLESLNKRIRELTAERDELQAYVDSRTALVSYPRRLPPDVIREIFLACLPTHRNAVMSAQEAPLLLARICSAWRYIALTTPRLWSSLHIPVGFVLEKPEQRIPAVSLWLQRSGARPITLSLSFLNEIGSVGYVLAHEGFPGALLDCLAESASRWRKIEVWDVPQEVAQRFAAMIQADSSGAGVAKPPAPRQLSIYRTSRHYLADWRTAGSQLDTFLLQPVFCAWFTHLSLGSTGPRYGLSASDVFSVLRQCPRLIVFAFLPPQTWQAHETSSTSITHPLLQSFSILRAGDLSLKSLGRLLDNLDLPALQHLAIPTKSLASGALTSHSVSLSRMSPLLKTLHINLPSFTEAGVQQTLGHFCNLIELSVANARNPAHAWGTGSHPFSNSESCSPARLLRLLIPSRGETSICPSLQRLEIRGAGPVTGSTIQAFLMHRVELSSGFSRFVIDGPEAWGEPLSPEQCEVFRSCGVEFEFLLVPEKRLTAPAVVKSNAWTGLPSAEEVRTPWGVGSWE